MTYRHRTRACAACGAPMRAAPADEPGHAAVLVDACDQCGCVFLEYFDGEPGALARGLTKGVDRPGGALALAEAELRCPDCDSPFELRRYLDTGPSVYRCGACLAVFATPSQLHALAEHRHHDDPEPTFLDRLLRLFT